MSPSLFRSDHFGHCGGHHHPATHLPQEETSNSHCSDQRGQQVSRLIRRIFPHLIVILFIMMIQNHTIKLCFIGDAFQSCRTCDVVSVLPTADLCPSCCGDCLLGHHCCVSSQLKKYTLNKTTFWQFDTFTPLPSWFLYV